MGACAGRAPKDEATRDIESRLRDDEMDDRRAKKLLFLGPGGSGKSTIFKQLQYCYGDGFDEKDCLLLREHIYAQITSQMKSAIKHFVEADMVVNRMNGFEEVPAPTAKEKRTEEAISTVMKHSDLSTFPAALCSAIAFLYREDERIRSAFDAAVHSHRKRKRQLLEESTVYFLEHIERVGAADFSPTKLDIVKVRRRTTGVIARRFDINGFPFHIFDVGGQRSERRKWIHCFEGVHAVVFVVSLSSYNEVMFEDARVNCMVDALQLFGATINNKWFCDTPVILFLNKRDLFTTKIAAVKITECAAFADFDDYKHDAAIHRNANDYEQATSFIRLKFEAMNESTSPRRKQIYTHLTCAMDQSNVEAVFNDVTHIVIQHRVRTAGFA